MDRDLVVQAQRGDLGAFEALATSSHPRLFRVALGILRDADRAEDATQATMVDVWRYLPRLRDPQAFDSWSYRLLVRACSREARDVPRRLPEIEIGSRPAPPAADTIAGVADRDQLERGFRRLSVEHRAVIVLRYLMDLPHDRIAEALDIAPGTVGSRLNRAMGALRAAIEADDRPAPALAQAREADR